MSELTIWMLDDGTPGHWSMTEGMVGLIAAQRTVRTKRIRVRWRWGAIRQIFQRIEKTGIHMPAAVVRLFSELTPSAEGRPDLIVSRGGGTLFMNVWLARETRAKNIFIGTIRGLPPRMFGAVISQRVRISEPPYFTMPLMPTRIDQAQLADKVAGFPWRNGRRDGLVACLFLGGDGSGYVYTDEDWRALGKGVRRLHEQTGVRWCIATSRRTPAGAEQLMREEIPDGAIIDACWWQAGDRRRCMEAFMGAAQQAFCTEDSMSMLEECIASGRPTVSLRPMRAKPNEGFSAFLQDRSDAGYLLRMEAARMCAESKYPVPRDWVTVSSDQMVRSAGKLLDRMGL